MTPFFFGPSQHRLHGVYHPPSGATRHGLQVLLCAPFGQEAIRTHRLHRLLAESLAGQGMHVMRFDYLGTGESSGDDTAGSITQWQNDILAAQEEMGRRTRASATVWVGTRLGGALALLASERSPVTPLRIVLWEPVLDGAAYAQELGAAHARHTFDPFIHDRRPAPELRGEALGFGVSDAWIQELRAISVASMQPRCQEGCHHIATRLTPCAEQLSSSLTSRGLAWRHQPTAIDMAWHVEEAAGAALAPPELLRLLVSAVRGQTA